VITEDGSLTDNWIKLAPAQRLRWGWTLRAAVLVAGLILLATSLLVV